MDFQSFEQDGFLVTSALLSEQQCQTLDGHLSGVAIAMAGKRSLLETDWCRALASALKSHPALSPFLPEDPLAVQCTLFEKSLARNWLVSLHQDLSIPVAERLEHPALAGWSEKEGGLFVQPPAEVLEKIVAVRLHLDDCAADDGPLNVVPGSHRHGRTSQEQAFSLRDRLGERVCPIARGAALLMRPLLLHSSSKATGHSRRRILHFLFAPRALPFGLRWHNAI